MCFAEPLHLIFPAAVIQSLHDMFFQQMGLAESKIFVKHAQPKHEKKHCTNRKNYHVTSEDNRELLNVL